MPLQQMVNREIPVIATIPFNEVEVGWMRENDGKIFFLQTWGRETICHQVMEDGTILRGADTRCPTEHIHLVHPKDLGIKEIKWAK